MNVFIKKLAAWDLMRTLGSENCGRVNQADAGALACYGTNHVIQLAVSAKAKSVEILRAHETLFGPGEVTDSPETTSDAKLELHTEDRYLLPKSTAGGPRSTIPHFQEPRHVGPVPPRNSIHPAECLRDAVKRKERSPLS